MNFGCLACAGVCGDPYDSGTWVPGRWVDSTKIWIHIACQEHSVVDGKVEVPAKQRHQHRHSVAGHLHMYSPFSLRSKLNSRPHTNSCAHLHDSCTSVHTSIHYHNLKTKQRFKPAVKARPQQAQLEAPSVSKKHALLGHALASGSVLSTLQPTQHLVAFVLEMPWHVSQCHMHVTSQNQTELPVAMKEPVRLLIKTISRQTGTRGGSNQCPQATASHPQTAHPLLQPQ